MLNIIAGINECSSLSFSALSFVKCVFSKDKNANVVLRSHTMLFSIRHLLVLLDWL